MNRCKHLNLLERRADGRELFICKINNVRLGSSTAGLCIKCEKYESDDSMPQEKFVLLNWMGDDEDNLRRFHCWWKIFVSDDALKRKDVETIKEWTDGKVKTTGKIKFTKSGTRGFELKIVGKGNDERCTWCKSFRTALNTRTGNLIEQRGTCRFG